MLEVSGNLQVFSIKSSGRGWWKRCKIYEMVEEKISEISQATVEKLEKFKEHFHRKKGQ